VKRLADLTAEDLRAVRVWRYEGGTGAEATVAPIERAALSQADDEIFLATTDFELFDGTMCFGYCFPADDSGLDYLQPVIVSGAQHVAFWFDGPADPEVLGAQWRALGKRPEEIFPVAFHCLVPVDGRTISGRIDGVATSASLSPAGPAPELTIEPEAAAPPVRILTARPVQARRDTGAVEKRTARRRKADMTVEFTQGSLHGTGIIGDLSRRGMFVRSSRVPGSGPALRLTVNLPNGRKLELTGRVIRTVTEPTRTAPSGFGLRLSEDSPEYANLVSLLRKKTEKS